MEINKSSWHYKLVKSFLTFPEESLCPYMRQVVGSMFIALVSSILAVLFVGFFVYGLFYPFFGDPDILMSFLSCFMWVLVGLALLDGVPPLVEGTWLSKVVYDCKEREEKEPSLVAAYLKAKHDKICPTITFK
jgi:hypothetical protein